MRTKKIAVPLHITGFFSPRLYPNPLFSGSLGAGLLIEPGIKCQCQVVEKVRQNRVFFNNKKVKIASVEELFNLIKPKVKFLIKLFSPVDLGLGYGASAASALAVSLAVCSFLKKPAMEAAQLAYIAEVNRLTGLADVSAIFSGKGLVARTKPGAPGVGKIKSFPLPASTLIITADLKKKETKKMLKSMGPETGKLGLKFLNDFLKKPSLEKFFSFSQLFSIEMGFAKKEFFEKLKPLKKYSSGFAIKKGVFFAAVDKKSLPKAKAILENFSPRIHIFKPVSTPYFSTLNPHTYS